MTDEYAKQFRSPAERQQDEADEAEKEAHEDGLCDPTFCWYCINDRERGEESCGG